MQTGMILQMIIARTVWQKISLTNLIDTVNANHNQQYFTYLARKLTSKV